MPVSFRSAFRRLFGLGRAEESVKPATTSTAQPDAVKHTKPLEEIIPAPAPLSSTVTKAADVDTTLGRVGIDRASLRSGAADLFTTVGAAAATAVTEPEPSGEPSIHKLYQDPEFKKLHAFAIACTQAIDRNDQQWDKLTQIRNFTAAANFVNKGTPLPGEAKAGQHPLFHRFRGTQERRAMAHLLLLLMPREWRAERPMYPDGGRGPAQDLFHVFPDSVITRADSDFQIEPGDLPKLAPIFTQHLQQPDLLDRVFRSGQHGIFLASKEHCPGAFLQDRLDINPPDLDKKQQVGHEGDPIMVRIEEVVEVNGRRLARCSVPPQPKVWLDNGACVKGETVFDGTDVKLDTSGRPLLGPDGKPQPILIPVEHLADYLLDPGDGRGMRGLDLSQAEDRAIALTFASELKATYLTDSNGITKNLFDWLQQADQRTPPHDLERIKARTREAAWQTIAKHACHPRRTHFKIDLDPRQPGWQQEAFDLLQATGMMQDCGNRYEKDKSTTAHVHELAWTAHFLERGFVGGSLDCYGLATAYDKLAATFLAPLGVVSTTDIAEGHGAELVRILSNPDEDGVVQVGMPEKSKQNEFIFGLAMDLSSGRGPAAQYMENWGGYLKIDGCSGQRYDFAALSRRADEIADQGTP